MNNIFCYLVRRCQTVFAYLILGIANRFRLQSYYKIMNFQSFLGEKFTKYSKFIVTFAEK